MLEAHLKRKKKKKFSQNNSTKNKFERKHTPPSKIVKDIHQHRAVSRKARGIKAKEARSFWAWRQRKSQ